MTNTVSHHKVWMARIAGLFVLTALAAMYLAFPLTSMAVNIQNLSLQKPANATGVTIKFMGPVQTFVPSNVSSNTGSLNFIRFNTVGAKDILKGEWVAVSVQDKATNETYGWTCTIFDNAKNNTFPCVLGQPSNSLLTSQAVVSRLQGKLVNFTVTPDANGNITISQADLSSSGWGSASAASLLSAPATTK